MVFDGILCMTNLPSTPVDFASSATRHRPRDFRRQRSAPRERTTTCRIPYCTTVLLDYQYSVLALALWLRQYQASSLSFRADRYPSSPVAILPLAVRLIRLHHSPVSIHLTTAASAWFCASQPGHLDRQLTISWLRLYLPIHTRR